MQDSGTKQQVVDRIKNASNILVTVGRDPSVDALTALLALTLMINKLDKRATAVFSGTTPPAITFLKPGATFESTVNSLRDFIIALDKNKADRLRYKVEDDVVRVFITPYKTTITEKDLMFSQGDFNVDLVVALGVERQQDLDAAITAHGRILHDAAVVTINTASSKSDLGNIDWNDNSASCLSEMVMAVGDALKPNSLDEQIATALLTGIVAATNRFSNINTQPRVMTLAAQLMAAGANQQLIAAKLEQGHVVSTTEATESDSTSVTNEETPDQSQSGDTTEPSADGDMRIAHSQNSSNSESSDTQKTTLPASRNQPSKQPKSNPEAPYAPKDAPQTSDETALSRSLPSSGAPTLSVSDLHHDLEAASRELDQAAAQTAIVQPERSFITDKNTPPSNDWRARPIEPPVMGGTLNATTEDAEEARRQEELSGRNRTILSHDAPSAAISEHEAANDDKTPDVDNVAPAAFTPPPAPVELAFEATPAPVAPRPSVLDSLTSADGHSPTLAEIEEKARAYVATQGPDGSTQSMPQEDSHAHDVVSARAAVEAALSGDATAPISYDIPPISAVPSATSVGQSSDPVVDQPSTYSSLPTPGFDTSSLPPMPDFSTLPPLPGAPAAEAIEQPQVMSPSPLTPTPEHAVTPAATDPGQFRIPGQ